MADSTSMASPSEVDVTIASPSASRKRASNCSPVNEPKKAKTDDDEPTEATTAAPSSAAAAAASLQLSLARLLYADGLHSIFKFLSLKELPLVVATCRSWRDAACTDKNRRSASCTFKIYSTGKSEAICELKSRKLLPEHAKNQSYSHGPFRFLRDELGLCLGSALRQHLSTLSVVCGGCFNQDLYFSLAVMTDLARLPSLTSLKMDFELWEVPRFIAANVIAHLETPASWTELDAPARSAAVQAACARLSATWPQKLQHLTIGLEHGVVVRAGAGFSGADPATRAVEQSVEQGQALIHLTAGLPALTSLSVAFNRCRRLPEGRDWAPLAGLDHLTGLSLRPRIIERELKQIKQMHLLQSLCVGEGHWLPEDLHHLLSPPHALQALRVLALGQSVLTVEHLTALVNLPQLTHMLPREILADALPLLSHFPCLVKLALNVVGTMDPIGPATILKHVPSSSLAKLTELDVNHCTFAPEDQALALCSAMPNLQVLHASKRCLPSLRHLRVLTQLRELNCEFESEVAEHLLELQHVPSLRKAKLWRWGDDRLVERLRAVAKSPLLNHITTLIINGKDARTGESAD